MGQLTNLYVSESYQGLLKLADSTTGVTSTLQYVQDGLGNNTALQISKTQVNITGTFTVNGAPVGGTDTGSLMKTGSVAGNVLTFTKGDGSTFNLTVNTGSVPSGTISGSQQIIDLGFLQTSSFNSYTSSNDSKVNSLIASTGSYATTSSLTSLSQSIATTDLGQNNRLTALEGVTGSINRNGLITTGSIGGTQSITGSLNVEGTISATSASFTYVNTVYETASVIYSSGSNQFGDASNDTQTLWGTVNLPSGPLVVTGSVTSTGGFTGSLQGTASFAQTASVALNGGVTQLLAGPNITLSPISGIGQVTISSTGTGTGSFNTATGSYGSFYDTTIQTNPVANTPNSMSFNNTAITNGVSISGSVSPFNTYIKTEDAGTYNIQFSAQVEKTDSGTDEIDIWIRKNGIDLVDTGTKLTLQNNNTKVVAAWNWFVQSATNDYYQLIWSSADTGMRLFAEPSSSLHPGIPSVIATANRVDQFLSNTGSFTGSFIGSFTGSLEGTASFATNALSASFAPMPDVSYFATTGSNNFIGNQTITGSVILSGSAGVELDVKGDTTITGSLNVSGSSSITDNLRLFSNTSYVGPVQPGAYITQSSPVSQSNVIFSNPNGQNGQNPIAAGQTGSIVISGSNNILFSSNRTNSIPQGTYGYIGGSTNYVSTIPTLTTSSATLPAINNNFIQAGLALGFTTSSLGPSSIGNNNINGTVTLNHQSGSINFNNNVVIAGVTSTQQLTPGKAAAFISSNILYNTNTLNHQSSSITFNNNIAGGLTINNFVSSSFSTATNGTTFNANIFAGSSNAFFVSGSASSAQTRQFNGNIIVGNGNSVSSSAVASNNAHLNYTAILGYQLIVSASNANNTGGSAFLGRFNGIDNGLDSSQNIVFAVGTGTPGNRRTGFWIDSGSFTNVSGALNITGSATSTAGFTGSLQGTASYASQALTASFAQNFNLPSNLITTGSLAGTQTILGTLRISGSSPLQVGTENNVGKINTYGGSNWLYRNSSNYNTVIGNVAGVDNGFFGSSEKNMILNGFFTPFSTGSNNVIIQGAGDDFISGSNNIFIGSHSGHAGGFGSILLGSTSYPSGSIFDSKFELGTQADSRIFHKDNGGAPLQIGYNTQVTGSLLVSNGLTVSGSIVATGSVKGNVSTLTIASNTASLDLSKGNFFTLQLVEGTDTRIEPTSIAAGQTINIKLNTTGSATVSFPASVKQVSGSPYVPTTTTSVDVITLVSFDNTDLYLANVKNLV